jgi:bacterioferritin-associated ferredoxin
MPELHVYVCVCNAISDHEIRGAVALGARSLDDLRGMLGVATCCGRCADCATDLIGRACDEPSCTTGGD